MNGWHVIYLHIIFFLFRLETLGREGHPLGSASRVGRSRKLVQQPSCNSSRTPADKRSKIERSKVDNLRVEEKEDAGVCNLRNLILIAEGLTAAFICYFYKYYIQIPNKNCSPAYIFSCRGKLQSTYVHT